MIRILELLRDLRSTPLPTIKARKRLIESGAVQSTLHPPKIASAHAHIRDIVHEKGITHHGN